MSALTKRVPLWDRNGVHLLVDLLPYPHIPAQRREQRRMQDPLKLVHLDGFTIREIPTRSIHCYIVRAWLGPEARVWPATVAAGLVVWRSTVYLQVMGFNLSVRPRGRNAIWRGIW
jgi:hypothetical protein